MPVLLLKGGLNLTLEPQELDILNRFFHFEEVKPLSAFDLNCIFKLLF